MQPTIKDIAQMTGVSVSTVSYVLNGKGRVSEEKRKLILEKAKEIGYVPNRNARNLVQKVTGKIGLFIPGLEYLKTSTFFNNLMSGILSVVRETDNDLYLDILQDENDEYVAKNLDVDGAIFLHPVNDDAYYQLLFSKKVPFVMVGRPDEAYEQQVTYVDLDNLAISYNGTRKLLEQKHQAIAMVMGDERLTISADQLAGYQMALQEHGVIWDPSMVLYTDFIARDHVDGLMELLKVHPETTAIVAASDTQATSVVLALLKNGISVPGDMSVLCLSGSSVTNFYNPPITSFINPSYELGRRAAMKVCDLIKRKALRPSTQILEFTEFEGASVAAPRKNKLTLK